MSNWARYSKNSKSILDCIGNTPLVRLNRVTKDVASEILVKLEYLSPSGSLKDRIYLNMIERAEKRGELKHGMTILECSTGNAGIACSFVAAVKGYPCIIVMPEGMSEERKKMDVAYGTQMVYTPGGELDAYVGTQGTGGQLTGIGRYLRGKKKKIKLYAGEPAECPLLSRREWGEHKIEGIGDGFVPRDLDLSLLDGIVTIKSDEAIEM